MKVGEAVLLVDGRGCSTVHVVQRGEILDGELTMASAVWRRTPFKDTGRADGLGRRVYRSKEPAIGPAGTAYDPLYLPAGWHPPSKHP